MTAAEALNQIARLLEPRPLNKIQRLIFLRSWEGTSYGDIARQTDYDLGYVRDSGSKLWQMLSEAIATKVTKNNLSAVLQHHLRQNAPAAVSLHPSQDWGEAVDTSVFYGREGELATLEQWIGRDRCRLITLLGLGGAGKTTLAAKLARQLAPEFDYVLWRSLRTAPHLDELLTAILQFLGKETAPQGETEQQKLSRLQLCLQNHRCLIVLDNFDTLFAPNQASGAYQKGYENYLSLMRSLCEIPHQSSILITSREAIAETRAIQGQQLAVREWQLGGLDFNAVRQLLTANRIVGTADEIDQLVKAYQGNALALKIAASSIQSLFLGQLKDFWQQGAIAWGGDSAITGNPDRPSF